MAATPTSVTSKSAATHTVTTTGTTEGTSQGGFFGASESILQSLVPGIQADLVRSENAANEAAASALAVTNDATTASNAATQASNSETAAEGYKDDAEGFKNQAATSASEAEDWARKTTGLVTTDYSAKAWAIGGTGVDNSGIGGSSKD